MSLLNLFIATLIAYGACALPKGRLLSVYELFSDENLLMKYVIVLLAALIVLYAIEQWRVQGKRIKAAMTLRRAPGLRQHMIDGVQGGSFAYLAKQVEYGSDGDWLPPMAVVFVICDMEEVESDPTREHTMLVVPYFKEVDLQRPSIAVEVPKKDLYKHIPRHMIPEII